MLASGIIDIMVKLSGYVALAELAFLKLSKIFLKLSGCSLPSEW